MKSALHITTTIQPGNKIELQIPESGIGDTVEVFVILKDKATNRSIPAGQQSILATIDTIHSQQPTRTAEEIEQQIQEARDGWDN
jgi:predicted metal-dependent RNase